MKLQLECIACMLKQIVEAGRMSTDDETKIRKIINLYSQMIPDLDLDITAPAVTEKIQSLIKKETGLADPYQAYKRKHIKLALEQYPVVKKLIEESDDTIKAALIMAASGNSIDAGLSMDVNVSEVVKAGMETGFYYSDIGLFEEKLKNAKTMLIVADNSGETVFDKLFIEELLNLYDLKITYAVRAQPVLNDVTIKEASQIGLNQVANLIDSGCNAPGMLIEQANEDFRNSFNQADIIISKGQGNYEGLTETDQHLFYLLKAKCKVIAREFSVPTGSLIFKYI